MSVRILQIAYDLGTVEKAIHFQANGLGRLILALRPVYTEQGPAQSFNMSDPLPWIAIVDDDPSVLKALTRLLRTSGYQARAYASAQEFLTTLPESEPLCLILDLQMPEMNGLELLQNLTRRGIDIPTVIITANNDLQAREQCISAGAFAYLLKPLQRAALMAAVDEARRRGVAINGRGDELGK